VREGSIGLFAQNTVQWTDWFRSIVGARIDRHMFSVVSDNPANSGDVSDHIVSPKLGLVFAPWPRTEFFLNYGQGFHSNDARGTVTHVDPQTGDAVEPVTPLVKSRGAEVGWRRDIAPGFTTSLAVWRLALDSELVFSGDAGNTEPSRASLRRGIEWSNHWIVRSWLLLDLDLSASRARFTQYDPVGDYIPGSVDRVASFGLTVPHYRDWFGEFQWRYFGPRPLIEDNSVRSQSSLLASLRIGRQIDSKLGVHLDIFNLFNRKVDDIDYYYLSRLAGEPAAGVNDIHFHPAEPLSARVTLTAKF
jgi:outer membrane receptor protein involved in Fe transport